MVQSDLLVRPEEVSLCILISALVVPPAEELGWGVQFDGHQALRRLAVLLLREVKAPDRVTYTPLRELLVHLQQELGTAGSVLAGALVRVLQTLQSPDDIITVFESLSELLISSGAAIQAPNAAGLGRVDPQSPLGLFLRRCRAAFDQLPFEAVVQLHGAIQLDLQLAITGQQGPAGAQQASLREQRSLDAFLNDTVHMAERKGSSLPMAAIEQQLQTLAPVAQHLPRLQYARLSNALQHQDYLGALDALHHYFDYTGSAGAAGLGGGAAAAQANGAEALKGRYQSALLSLSAAHASFGHPQEALQALHETLRVAQQGGDAWCLLHALAALCRTLDMTGGMRPGRAVQHAALDFGAAEEQLRLVRLLKRCLDCSIELQCPHLAAFARVALARFTLQHATELDEDRAAHSIEDPGATSAGAAAAAAAIGVQRALRATKNLAHASAMAAAAPGTIQPPPGAPPPPGQPGPRTGGVGDLFNTAAVFGPQCSGTERSSAAAVAQTAGAAHLLQCGAWRKHGCTPLSLAHALTYLCCYSADGRAEERALAYAQLAELVSERRGFGAGEAVLALAEEGRSGQSERALVVARLASAHRRALNQGDMLAAEVAAQDLELLADPGEGLDAELKLEAAAMHVNVLLASGAICEAHTAAGRLFDQSMAAGLPESAVRALLLLARAHSDAGDALGAFPYVLAALLHCRLLGLDVLGAEAAVALARLWGVLLPPASSSTSGNSSSTDGSSKDDSMQGADSSQAVSKGVGASSSSGGAAYVTVLLSEVMPLVMAHGGLELQGEAQLAAADALLATVGPGAELVSVARQAGELLRRAASAFEGAMCWGRAAGAQSLLAHMCHAVGDVGGRDEAAALALQLAESVAAVEAGR